MDLEEIETEISALYQTPGLTLKKTHELIARHVALMVMEARVDELTMYEHGLGFYDSRIAELKTEIAKLKETTHDQG